MGRRDLEFWNKAEFSQIVKGWPESVRRKFGHDLHIVQTGSQPKSGMKPLSGFAIPLCQLKHRDGQRVVYCTHYVTLTGKVFVLDAFEKDSGDGSEMRKSDKERIEGRVAALKRQMDQLKKDLQSKDRTLN